MISLKTLLIYTLILLRFCCSAQNKEYHELIAPNPIIEEAFAQVHKDTKGLPIDKMIYFVNIIKRIKTMKYGYAWLEKIYYVTCLPAGSIR